ncbi:MAG: hypothetical protein AB7F78_14120 [Hyphomicrobiaceae bacterium]
MQLIEVRPVKPFVGSYRCSVAEADMIDEQFAEKDGVVIKEKVPRKRFIGLIPVTRAIRPDEVDLHLAGKLPGNIEVDDSGRMVTEHPKQRTLHLPPAVASSLISRGLAVKVDQPEPKKKAA